MDYVLDESKASRSQNEASLRDAVDDALNRDKTEQDLFQSAIGCTCETAFEDMCRIKEMWHKEKGVQGFHLVQSFAAGEVSPELAHQIGLEFADRLLGGEFQAVISTHLNTKCIHNHIVWNSVSIQTGKKYRSNAKTYVTQVRRISDELCRKYELSVIQTPNSEKAARPYAQWLAERDGKPTWKTAIQQDIDAAVSSAFTWRQFLHILEGQGYAFKLDRKYITLQPPGKERPVRFKTLGRDYTPEAIQRRILAPRVSLPAERRILPPRRMALRTGGKPVRKLTSLRALYFSYLYKMGALKKKPRRPSFAVREDIRRLDRRIEQMNFLSERRIDSREQLTLMRMEAEQEIAALLKERQKLYRYEPDPPQIAFLTSQLKERRKVVRLCKNIEQQSIEMERRMGAARLQEQRREPKAKEQKRTDDRRR